jgi:hypothetical protein
MTTAVLRLAVAALVVAAVVATLVAVAPVVLVNFFGFFTVQSNLIGAAVAVAGAVRLLGGAPVTTAWTVVRWAAATYLVVVGLVYWALLAPLGAAGGVPLPWANLVLHLVTPVAALVDLVLARDRAPVPLRLLPLVLVHPLLWTAVVLIRGATDGWVPYPFLSPAQGYGVVAVWVVVVAAAFTAAAALLRLVVGRTSRSTAR